MLIFGGSWGSILALIYGWSFPSRCKYFILKGIFLEIQSEIGWLINGMNKFFPESNQKIFGWHFESKRKKFSPSTRQSVE